MHPSQTLFIGMDIHKETHAVWAGSCFGEEYLSHTIANEPAGFEDLAGRIRSVAKERSLEPIFGLEDTYGNGEALATALTKEGFNVKTVPPVLVHRLSKRRPMPEKSDLLDAKWVAKVLIHEGIDTLPDYRISQSNEIAKSLRDLVNDRSEIVFERTRLKNQLHNLLYRRFGTGYKKLFKNPFSQKALKYWREEVDKDKITDTVSKVIASQLKRKINRLLTLKDDLKTIESETVEILKESGTTLLTLPGCGIATAGMVLAEVKDIDRFRSPSALAKYAGVSPRENSSGKSRHFQKTKAGNRRLNKALHAIALASIGKYGPVQAKTYYQKKLLEGKTPMRAITCLKRRLLEIIYVILKQKVAYDPTLNS